MRRPAIAEVAALVALALLVAIRFRAPLASPEPLPDETNYVRGFAAAAAGRSPYVDTGFLGPPLLARCGAAAIERWGLAATLAGLRATHVAGLVALLWYGLAPLGATRGRRLLLAAALALLLPGAWQAMFWGNLSLETGGLVAAGLALWPAAPVFAGALLGASVLLKPIAPVAVLALLVHRPRPDADRRAASPARRRLSAHVVAALVAGAVGGAILLLPPGLGDFLARSDAGLSMRSASWHRLLHLAGISPPPLVPLALVALATVAWVRRRPRDPALVAAMAAAAALAATPLVWNHTLLLAIPCEAIALRTLVARRRAGTARWFETAGVALGVAAVSFAEGATGIYDSPVWLQVAGVLPPAIAPVALCVYAARCRCAEGAQATASR